jgi:hypothetical protein
MERKTIDRVLIKNQTFKILELKGGQADGSITDKANN